MAVNEHHPLATLPYIELTDIRDEPMLTLALDKSAFPRYLIACCVKAGFQPTIFQEASEPQTLLAMVGAALILLARLVEQARRLESELDDII